MLLEDKIAAIEFMKNTTASQMLNTSESKRFALEAIENTLTQQEATEERMAIIRYDIERSNFIIEQLKELIALAKQLPRYAGMDQDIFEKIYADQLASEESMKAAQVKSLTTFEGLIKLYEMQKRFRYME